MEENKVKRDNAEQAITYVIFVKLALYSKQPAEIYKANLQRAYFRQAVFHNTLLQCVRACICITNRMLQNYT
jgi:hypothetical protein